MAGKRNRKDTAEFSFRLFDNIAELHEALASKTYRHGGYDAFRIIDPKPRDIHKASVRDRLVHHAIYRVLYPFFDRKFIYDSYSCRVGKGTHRAMNRFQDFARSVSKNDTRTCWVLKCDIRKFFASIDHVTLKKILARKIIDSDILELLEKIIDSFHTKGNVSTGLPLGNLTSQLLVNVYMNEFDHFVKRKLKVRHYIRYADDFVVLHEDKKFLEELIPIFSQYLERNLKLSLHPDKVFIKTLASGVDFLGWVHFPRHRVLRTATKRRMVAVCADPEVSDAILQSYFGLLSHGNAWKLQKNILAQLEKTKTRDLPI